MKRKCLPKRLLPWLFALLTVVQGVAKGDAQTDSLIKRGEELVYGDEYVEGIRLLTEAQKRLKAYYDAGQDYRVNYGLGVGFFMVTEYGKALDYFYAAYTLCDTHSLRSDLKARTLNAIAGVYFDQQNYEKAWDIVMENYKAKDAERDTDAYIICATDLALIANKWRQFDKTEELLQSARRLLKPGNEARAMKVEAIEAERLHLLGRYAELGPIAKMVSESRHVPSRDKTVMYSYLVEVYSIRGDWDSAHIAAAEGMRMAAIKAKPELYNSIAAMYQREGDHDRALQFKDSVIIYLDSIERRSNRELMAKSQMRLEMMKVQAENDKKLNLLLQHRKMLGLLVCICILIAAIALLYMRNRSRQHRLQMQLQLEKEQQERQRVEYQAKETELKATFQQQMMEQSLEQKNRELSATTLFVNSRNELLRSLIQQLEDIVDEHSSPSLHGLLLHLRQLLKNSSEKDTIAINFEKSSPDFFRIIKSHHADLSDSDIRFLSYVKMNMATKDIASLLNVNPDSIKRRKIRISKKLGLETSADLYSYIQSLT